MNIPHEVSLLTELVGTPSPSGREGAAGDILMKELPGLGWERVHSDEVGNVVAERGNGHKELVLLGHIDTVDGGPSCSLDNEELVGRGAVDAKGPLCCLAIAGGRVPLPGDWALTLIAAVGEESDSRGMRHRVGLHSPSACIVGEPTGGDGIVISYRGRVMVSLSAEDEGAHRSWSPGPMTASVKAASDVLAGLDGMDPAMPLSSRTSGAILSMSGTESCGRSARIVMDIRIPLTKSPEEVVFFIKEACSVHAVSVDILESIPAHSVKRSDPVVGALRNAIMRAEAVPRLLQRSGTADFNIAAAWVCPMAVYGPGDSLLEHTEKERVRLEEYLASIDILRSAIPNIFRILDRKEETL